MNPSDSPEHSQASSLEDPILDHAYHDWAHSVLALFQTLGAPAPSVETLAIALDEPEHMQELFEHIHVTVEHFCTDPTIAQTTQQHLEHIQNTSRALQELYQERRRTNRQHLKHHQAYLDSETIGQSPGT